MSDSAADYSMRLVCTNRGGHPPRPLARFKGRRTGGSITWSTTDILDVEWLIPTPGNPEFSDVAFALAQPVALSAVTRLKEHRAKLGMPPDSGNGWLAARAGFFTVEEQRALEGVHRERFARECLDDTCARMYRLRMSTLLTALDAQAEAGASRFDLSQL